MENPIPVDLSRIAQDMQIRRVQVESVVQLLDEGCTVPFITRYRKERTGNLSELAIREIQHRAQRLRELSERKASILKTIEAQGKLTDELAAAIRAADNPKRLEDLYLPYKPKKRSKASEAREKGLEPLALAIWNRDESLTDLAGAAAELVNAEKGLENVDQVLEGVRHILAEAVSELSDVRHAIRGFVWKVGKLVSSKLDSLGEGQGLEFRDYFQFSEACNHIPPHRVLAMNRGEKEGALRIKLEVPRADLENMLTSQLPLEGHPHAEFFSKAALDGLDRLLFPSLEREIRRDLTEMAERHALDVFARNLRSLLLQPPIARQTVLAIDPGFRSGCKVAVLDPLGNLLEHAVIHPHQPQNKRSEAKGLLKEMVGKHAVTVVAIGNGTASRETEELVTEIIAEGTYFTDHPDATSMPVAPAAPGPAARSAEPETATTSADTEKEAAQPATAEVEAPAGDGESPGLSAEASAESTPSPPAEEPVTAAATSSEAEPPASGEAEAVAVVTDASAPESFPPISGGAPEEGEEERATAQLAHAETLPPFEAASAAPSETPANGDTSANTAEPAIATNEQHTTPLEPEQSADVASEAAPADVAPLPVTADAAAEAEGNEAGAPLADGTQVVAGAAATAAAPLDPTAGRPSAQRPAKGPSPEFARPPKASKDQQQQQPQPKPPRPKQPPSPPKPHAADGQLAKLSYVIVNEAGASVYSASAVGREDFPEHDATTRGTISIGRRLQDPLAELVKIEPQNIGVGLYQHDVNPKHLKESLESVVESCVNFVGVDVNSASVPLLRLVSGLNSLTARRLVDQRKEKGPFKNREQILEVEGIGPATFTQAAGFLKIRDGENPFDRTWVHPESYAAANKLLEKLGSSAEAILDKEQLIALRGKLPDVDIPAMARELEVGEPTLRDIFDALARPDRDPRDDLPKPIFKKGVLKLEDLAVGMELKGTVLNVVDFGAFVDVGLKDSGLVHISQLANRFIKSPHDVVSVGDVVTVWVSGVDNERKRVSLTMVRPGTPRAHGPQPHARGRRGGGGGPAAGEGRPQGHRDDRERRGGPGRPPAHGQGHGGQGQGQGPDRRPPRRDAEPTQQAGGEAPAGGAEKPAGPPASPPPPRVSHRIPGPPQRLQQGGRGGGPRRGGPGGHGHGSGGGPGGPGRVERAQAPKPPAKPSKPAPPPPPLSKDALTGNVPLRTFGQLKQLYEERSKPEAEPAQPATDEPPAPPAPQAAAENSAPDANSHSADPAPAQEPATTDSSAG
jgi:uncharacterized protein